MYFWRFLRLGVVAALVYWLLFVYVHSWLFDEWYVRAHARSRRRTHRLPLACRACTRSSARSWSAANVVFDYAKVRLVVEDRRSALGALRPRWPSSCGIPAGLGLYALNALVFALVIALWALIAPGAGGAGGSMWLGVRGPSSMWSRGSR